MRALMLLFVAALLACDNSRSGYIIPPPNGGTHYDPGSAPSGSYGSGSGSPGAPRDGGALSDGGSADGGGPVDAGPPPPVQCAESDRRCDHLFSYRSNGAEQSVEVLGSFNGWTSNLPLTLTAGVWTATVPIPWNTQVIYKFHVRLTAGGEQWIPDPTNPTTVDDGYGGLNSVLAPTTCAYWTCVHSGPACDAPPPAGVYDWRDAVLYFVFVDRFLDADPTNDDPLSVPGLDIAANWRGGDWAGVRQKIREGYFQSLGVNTLWITVPMMNSDSSGIGDDGRLYSAYHGYWPTELGVTEPRFGTAVELQALVDEAHAAGLRVLVDYAMNHVHKDSTVYQQHQSDGWFNPLHVGSIDCICGTSDAQTDCTWDGPNATRCWFRDYLPDFNFDNADARRYSVDNALSWLTDYGVDGLRLDAVKHIELSWLTDLRARLRADVEPTRAQHIYLVGETFSGDPNAIKRFVDPCTMLDGQFDFPMRYNVVRSILLRQGPISDLAQFMDGNTSTYGTYAVMSTFVGNHDVPRSIHFAQDTPIWTDPWANGKDRAWSNQPGTVAESSAYDRLSVAMAVLFTNRGIPLLYYGDEIGLAGAGDPDNRRLMPWSGYTAGQQLLLDRVKKLGAIRAAQPALRRGVRRTLQSDNDVWAYEMADGTDKVYVVLNRADTAGSAAGLPSGTLRDLITAESLSGPTVSVPARSFRILKP
jgi:glycosidase